MCNLFDRNIFVALTFAFIVLAPLQLTAQSVTSQDEKLDQQTAGTLTSVQDIFQTICLDKTLFNGIKSDAEKADLWNKHLRFEENDCLYQAWIDSKKPNSDLTQRIKTTSYAVTQFERYVYKSPPKKSFTNPAGLSAVKRREIVQKEIQSRVLALTKFLYGID